MKVQELDPGFRRGDGGHKSVLLDEVLQFLSIKPDGLYVDGTLGLGGHAEAMAARLNNNGRLLGLDVDYRNLEAAKRRLQPYENLITARQGNFRDLKRALDEMGWQEVDGMLFDLGVASPQLDDPARGLSFQLDGPLDMRLDLSGKNTALSLLQRIDQKKLEEVLIQFGDGRFARRLSRSILSEVAQGRIKTTRDLAALCERSIGRRGKTHPATRVFLALRCLVNDELGALKDLLAAAPHMLKIGGRLLIISFHSLEDRMVKECFRGLVANESLPQKFSILTKKPLVPSDDEQHSNLRSRSAKLRVLERVA